jgi:hypothetical protein
MGGRLGVPVNSNAVKALHSSKTIDILGRNTRKPLWTIDLSTSTLVSRDSKAFEADRITVVPASKKDYVEYRGRTGSKPYREFHLRLNRVDLRTFEGEMYEGQAPLGMRLVANVIVYTS